MSRKGWTAEGVAASKDVLASEAEPLDVNDVVRLAGPRICDEVGAGIDVRLRLDMEVGTLRGTAAQVEAIVLALSRVARETMPAGGAVTVETSDVIVTGEGTTGHGLGSGERRVALAVICEPNGLARRPGSVASDAPPPVTHTLVGQRPDLDAALSAVEELGGRLRVSARPGRDTAYGVLLPLFDAACDREPRRPSVGSSPLRSPILVVDDDATVRRVVLRSLEEAGYTAEAYGVSGQALERLGDAAAEYELLITDVVMPGTSGLDLAERLASRRPSARVLFLSGYHAGAALGGLSLPNLRHAFLQKPFRQEQLIEAVRGLLDQA